jgi:hypothetical protein
LLTTLLSRDIVAARRGEAALATPTFSRGINFQAVPAAFGKTVSLLITVLAKSSKHNPQKSGLYSNTPVLQCSITAVRLRFIVDPDYLNF